MRSGVDFAKGNVEVEGVRNSEYWSGSGARVWVRDALAAFRPPI